MYLKYWCVNPNRGYHSNKCAWEWWSCDSSGRLFCTPPSRLIGQDFNWLCFNACARVARYRGLVDHSIVLYSDVMGTHLIFHMLRAMQLFKSNYLVISYTLATAERNKSRGRWWWWWWLWPVWFWWWWGWWRRSKKNLLDRPRRGGGVLPVMAYTWGLHPKGVQMHLPFGDLFIT